MWTQPSTPVHETGDADAHSFRAHLHRRQIPLRSKPQLKGDRLKFGTGQLLHHLGRDLVHRTPKPLEQIAKPRGLILQPAQLFRDIPLHSLVGQDAPARLVDLGGPPFLPDGGEDLLQNIVDKGTILRRTETRRLAWPGLQPEFA